MSWSRSRCIALTGLAGLSLLAFQQVGAMGLRSLVALPVDKGGSVLRLMWESADEADTDTLVTSLAYGFSARQTLLLGLPYRVDPGGDDRTGDGSLLYRHIAWQEDSFAGTRRLGLLLGAVVPSQAAIDSATQLGLVFTLVEHRNEIDADLVYQAGNGNRLDSARYDLSWQYRIWPQRYPEWGLGKEWNSVLELNGRWRDGEETVHQTTIGLQWIHPRMVFEGGLIRDISNGSETALLFSTRWHI